jgi:carboxyl-terminal processing protease
MSKYLHLFYKELIMKRPLFLPGVLLVGALSLYSFKFIYAKEDVIAGKNETTLTTVMRIIEAGHYAPPVLNDVFSQKVYSKYLENLDYDKKFFVQQDIDKLRAYENNIDDEIKQGSLEFYNLVDGLFQKRMNETEGFYKKILSTPMDFTQSEDVELDGKKVSWAANDKALEARWTKLLKYRVLSKYIDLKDAQQKRVDQKDSTLKETKTPVQLEADARKSVEKSYDQLFKRLQKLKPSERYSIYVNSITQAVDPHTDFLPPVDKQRFDEAMSGAFDGIGAVLRQEEGGIKIEKVMPGSPSWKQGQLKAGDIIIKVAQGAQEPVDVSGYEVPDAVDLIRGKRGTEVRLTVKKMDGSMQVIPIVRDRVEIEETFAKSAIIEGPKKVGYIYLPEFYADFNNANGRRCAKDVAIEIEKLKSEGVDAIILDLRNNGGGSLGDVVDMAGFFINKGPVVQVRSKGGEAVTMSDKWEGTLWDGPLAIMINENSASASEIMAAAMQDYKRAIIIGTNSFGKGTVQRVYPLDEYIDPSMKQKVLDAGGSKDNLFGSLKLTMQKFYRINGGSTQLKGVMPDIVLSDRYELLDWGERKEPSAMQWDQVRPSDYTATNSLNAEQLRAASEKRTKQNEFFALTAKEAQRLKQQQDDNKYSLNEVQYRKTLDDAKKAADAYEALEKKVTPLTLASLKADAPNINRDSSTVTKNKDWLKAISKDPYISETVNVLTDWLNSGKGGSVTIKKM